MARGRPRGSRNKPKDDVESSGKTDVGPGHNGPEPLTDEEQRVLAYIHKGAYEKGLAAKKAADAALKNICKLAKTEGVTVDTIKHLIALDSDEGRAKLEAEVQERLKAARWSGMEIGAQEDLFSQARQPAVEKAFAEGEVAGLNGADCRPPYDDASEQGQAWIAGHRKGQSSLFALLKKREAPAPLLTEDEAFPKEGAAEDLGEGLTDDEFDAAAPVPTPPTASNGEDDGDPAFLTRSPVQADA